ncbi:hypothetical protein HMPREF1146_0339 [Prevotella sp. MSX73]|uniref:Uncharacterized protein n=1 Tax=Segatella buccae ATCC 33574 TaxID=873513 RepID=E6K9R5_9BACT|nr:hypothetical protein HMPREF6485_2359 [Segatella buccae ATCC 33574]EJP32100.1 hypothetical protein HMPREF1146_0339 [Prevotella sp. MSX73]
MPRSRLFLSLEILQCREHGNKNNIIRSNDKTIKRKKPPDNVGRLVFR